MTESLSLMIGRKQGNMIDTVESAYFEVIRIKNELRIIRIHRERELKKMLMTDQECRASVHGGGSGPTPFLSCSLIADSCM